MSWTKQQFVERAYDMIGFGPEQYTIDSGNLTSGLILLEAMISTWAGKGIHIRYPIAADPESASLSTETSVPDAANEAVFMQLALRIAAARGKAVSPELKMAAKQAYDDMTAFATENQIPQMQMPSWVPRGAGQKPCRGTKQPFVDVPDEEPLYLDEDGKLQFRSK